MEATAKPVMTKGPVAGLNQTVISGRLEDTSSFESKGQRVHESLIKTPAPDEYSHPGTLMVQSKYKLGNKGEQVTVHCECTGFPQSWTDKDGVVKNSARNIYRHIE